MTEVNETEAAALKIVEEMKSPGKFDLGNALKKASYPVDDVTIFLDGEKAHELNINYDKVAELGFEAAGYSASNTGSITDAPEKEAIDAQIAELEEDQKRILGEIGASALTFRVRGVAPEQWRLIIAKWQREMRKQFDILTQEEEAATWANAKIDTELVSKAIVKITDADGNEDAGAIKHETAENLRGTVLESEWSKLLNAANSLTFANGLFNQVIAQDADFLSKRSPAPTSAGI